MESSIAEAVHLSYECVLCICVTAVESVLSEFQADRWSHVALIPCVIIIPRSLICSNSRQAHVTVYFAFVIVLTLWVQIVVILLSDWATVANT
jgi:hypothetical protein